MSFQLSNSQPQISNSSCVYHRLDLLPPQLQSKLCRHFDFPATLETGSVFLSPKAFLKPYRYTSQNMTEQRMQDLMNYLTNTNDDEDEDDLDIGVKILVKRDVHLLSQILSDWINMSFSSGMNNYIVRRFVLYKFFLFKELFFKIFPVPVLKVLVLFFPLFGHRVLLAKNHFSNLEPFLGQFSAFFFHFTSKFRFVRSTCHG